MRITMEQHAQVLRACAACGFDAAGPRIHVAAASCRRNSPRLEAAATIKFRRGAAITVPPEATRTGRLTASTHSSRVCHRVDCPAWHRVISGRNHVRPMGSSGGDSGTSGSHQSRSKVAHPCGDPASLTPRSPAWPRAHSYREVCRCLEAENIVGQPQPDLHDRLRPGDAPPRPRLPQGRPYGRRGGPSASAAGRTSCRTASSPWRSDGRRSRLRQPAASSRRTFC